MVETRSGLSVEPEPEQSPEGSAHDLSPAGRGDTAATRRGTASPRRRRGKHEGASSSHELTDSQAYTLLSLALGLMALPCIFTPKLAARMAFGSAAYPPEDQHTHTLGLLACGLLAAASVAFGLEECARRHMLHTFTADTLKMALAGFGGLNLILQLMYPATLTPWAAISLGVTQAALAALPASQLFVTKEDRGRVWRDFRRLPHTLRSAVWLRKPTLPGALYLVLSLAFAGSGLAYLLAPKTTLYHVFGYAYGKSTALAWRSTGAGLATVLAAMCYTLKDKAENDLLARPLSRTLNLGLMAASVGHLLVLGPLLNQGHGGALLPGLTATWATSLLASMAGLAAPEAATMAEAVAEAARTE